MFYQVFRVILDVLFSNQYIREAGEMTANTTFQAYRQTSLDMDNSIFQKYSTKCDIIQAKSVKIIQIRQSSTKFDIPASQFDCRVMLRYTGVCVWGGGCSVNLIEIVGMIGY